MQTLASNRSPWSAPAVVAGFAHAPPNAALMRFAKEELLRAGSGRALDIGCGAGRNAVPLAHLGWDVIGVDDSRPMLEVAARRARDAGVGGSVRLVLGAMERLPVRDRSCDLLVAHGIWNLARSARQFRGAVLEAARVARPGASLFLFTFSRNTLGADAQPVGVHDPFVFTQFSGQPQCFLTSEQLVAEMTRAGFAPDPGVPLSEYNRNSTARLSIGSMPVIYEAAFRHQG